MKLLLFALCLFFSFRFTRAQSVILNNPNQTYLIFENSAVLAVGHEKITIDSLLRYPEKYPFTSIKKKPIQADLNQAYWFKVDLTNPTPENYFLRFFYASDMEVRVYEVAKNQLITNWKVDFYGASTQDLFQRSRSILPLQLRQGQTHSLYFFVPKMSIPDPHIGLMSGQMLAKDIHYQDLFHGLFYGFIVIIAIYSFLLGIRLGDRDNILYSIWIIAAGVAVINSYGDLLELPGNWIIALKHNYGVHVGIHVILMLLFMFSFLQLKQRARWLYRIGVGLLVGIAVAIISLLIAHLSGQPDQDLQRYVGGLTAYLSTLFGLVAGITVALKGYRPGLFYALGSLSIIVFTSLFILSLYGLLPFTFWNRNSLFIADILEIIFYMLGLTYKVNLLKKNQEEAIQEQLRLTKENQTLIETQNRVLEEKVEQRTGELKASQAQLIQKEKLASLGELTAGIAHEIQNPLNFVNNFSEVSAELVDELREGPLQHLPDSEKAYAGAIVNDLQQNLQKITHHGNRAGAIVKGMLEHSKGGSGEKQETDLVRLTEECFKIAYQGYRSKHRDFSCELLTSFQPGTLPVQVVSQEIGRVVINLLTNAFYSVRERSAQQAEGYLPQVWVCVSRVNGFAELAVKDNGTGISESVKAKIFQPFFTTKPTGVGTGLGLSLSYDIIVKAHGGEINLESQEGNGAAFIVKLPI